MASLSYMSSGKLADLLTKADPSRAMPVRVLSSHQLALGADPLTPSVVIDFSNETVVPLAPGGALAPSKPAGNWTSNPGDVAAWRATRRGGDYWYEFKGKKAVFHSLRDLLSEGLKALETTRPGTLDKLSQIKPRSRRIVARDPKLLFDRQHLAKEYAEQLMDGWYYGTNNSADETNAWLKRACECAGLTWDKDFKTSLTPTIDDLA